MAAVKETRAGKDAEALQIYPTTPLLGTHSESPQHRDTCALMSVAALATTTNIRPGRSLTDERREEIHHHVVHRHRGVSLIRKDEWNYVVCRKKTYRGN